jgi:hypothetical protein
VRLITFFSSVTSCVVAVSAVYCTMPLSARTVSTRTVSTQKAELSDCSNSKASDRPGIGKGNSSIISEGKGRGCVGKKWGGTSGKRQRKNNKKM